ncbi:MAG: hypothetical protein ACR2FM_05245 [Candidatus Saccharimonadales bacterium]
MRKRLGKLPVIMLALLITVTPAWHFTGKALADRLASRSITIGSSQPGAATSHNFAFTIPNANTIGSIEFEYCANTPFIGTACTAPNGLDVSGVSLDAQTGATGFLVNNGLTNANRILITRVPSANLATQAATYDFSNAINMTDETTTFVRISLFASIDGTGPTSDSGAVAFATIKKIAVEAYVPPYLTFCVGITVANKCLASAGSLISLGELSKTSANYSTSQFAGATNDYGGYSVYMSGGTMTSGSKTIPALAAPGSNKPGTSQFGINMVANSNPGVGQNPIGSGTLGLSSGYGTANSFKFVNQVIAASSYATNYNTITVSYLVNVSNSQAPGVYATTITYIATAAF